MKHGARNDILAEVVEIKEGGVMALVKVELDGTDYHMSSVMTLDSLKELGIEKGSKVHVVGQGSERAARDAVTPVKTACRH